MPVSPTYPGVYIDEIPSSVHTITGVPTAVAAFVGPASRGPTKAPTHITSFADFQRIYGGLSPTSKMSYAVYAFYQNGGSEAEIVRIVNSDAVAATVTLPTADAAKNVTLDARGAGDWANTLGVRVDYDTAAAPAAGTAHNLTVVDTATTPPAVLERYLNVVADPDDPNSLDRAMQSSAAFAVPDTGAVLDVVPNKTTGDSGVVAKNGAPGSAPVLSDYTGDEAAKTGIHQLLKTDIFTILCLPGAPPGVLDAAGKLCLDRRAMLIVDPPDDWKSVTNAADGMLAATPVFSALGDGARNAAVYFPRLVISDPAANGAPRAIEPSGVMAGVWARTDVQRGVWKAPAGTTASLTGVTQPQLAMTDNENGRLNQLGVNCLRSFPVIGPVSWGARTLRGADRLGDQWKYLPVRRLALFLEESLYRGTQFAVFEPNDEPLWGAIRLNVGAFMNTLFKQGAFQGATAREAYFVKCDRENNPQNDIDRGILNILVGFAPLKPAEFVIIHIAQLAGQLQV